MVKSREDKREREQYMDEKVVRGQFMWEGADVGGGRLPINIISTLIGLNGNGEVKEVRNAVSYFHGELYGGLQVIHESRRWENLVTREVGIAASLRSSSIRARVGVKGTWGKRPTTSIETGILLGGGGLFVNSVLNRNGRGLEVSHLFKPSMKIFG